MVGATDHRAQVRARTGMGLITAAVSKGGRPHGDARPEPVSYHAGADLRRQGSVLARRAGTGTVRRRYGRSPGPPHARPVFPWPPLSRALRVLAATAADHRGRQPSAGPVPSRGG